MNWVTLAIVLIMLFNVILSFTAGTETGEKLGWISAFLLSIALDLCEYGRQIL